MNKIKKIYLYPVKIETHQEGGFHVKCPKLQGAWADGDTVKEAVDNLKDVIKHILEYQQKRREKIFETAAVSNSQAKLISDLNIAIYA